MAAANMASDPSKEPPGRLGDPAYVSHLSSALNRLRQEGSLCDVTVVVEDHRFMAHKAVLSCASEYFQSMFTSGFQESTSNEVTVPGTAQSFSHLLDFAYTGYFALSPTTVASVLNMACYMHFQQAVQVCASYLSEVKDSIDVDDCFEIWSVASNQVNLSELVESFRRHMVRSFHKCSGSESFVEHANVEFLLECLVDEEIETDSSTELQILQAVVAWLQFNWETRKEHTSNLLSKIRLGLVPEDNLQELLNSDIGNVEECGRIVRDVLELKRAGETVVEEPLSHRYPQWFATRNTISVFVQVEAMFDGDRSSSFSYFDDGEGSGGSWKKLDKMASLPCAENACSLRGVGLAVVNAQLYAAGGVAKRFYPSRGRYTIQSLGNFYKYNSRTNEWLELPQMTSKRKTFAMVGHEDSIFVIGGKSVKGIQLMEVERFSLAENQWKKCAPLLFPVTNMSAVSFGGKVIVLGSLPSSERSMARYLESMILQVYDPSNDVWHCVLNEPSDYHREIETYQTKVSLVTSLVVQENTLFLVNFICSQFEYTWDWYKPKVRQVELNFDLDPPMLTFSTIVQEQNALSSATLEKVRAFCIHDKVFVTAQGLVQEVNAKKGEDGSYDLSRWENFKRNCKVYSDTGGIVGPFTIDKQRLITCTTDSFATDSAGDSDSDFDYYSPVESP